MRGYTLLSQLNTCTIAMGNKTGIKSIFSNLSKSNGCLKSRNDTLPGYAIALKSRFSSSKSGQDEIETIEQTKEKKSSTILEATQWRKNQINEIERKFRAMAATDEKHDGDNASKRERFTWGYDNIDEVKSDDDVQQMWRNMESRVTKRRPLTLEQRQGKTGRRNVKKTDEDAWLEAGLYDDEKSTPQQ